MHNVLDDVVDKESGAKPKLVGPSASVGTAVRHISQPDLDGYVEGRLSGAQLDFVRGHLEACEACRAELTDLRTFKANAVGLNQASSLKRELERRRRQRLLKTGAAAAVAAALVALVGVVGWNKFGKAWVHTASVAPVSAHVVAAPQAVAHAVRSTEVSDARPAVAQPHAIPIAAAAATIVREPTAPPAHGAAAVAVASTASAAPQQQAQASVNAQARGTTPGTAPIAAQAHGAAAAAAAGSTSFALLGPFGDEVTDDRPEFAWQPLEGASKYSIIIVDEGLRPIAHTRLKTTTWRPKKPLRRGRSYLWQVTAILKNGTKVMATGPTSQEARIHIGAPAK